MGTKKKQKIIEKLKESGYTLYNNKWLEKKATDGFEEMMATMREREPEYANVMEKCIWPFEVVYYTAFEHAYNTFMLSVVEDDLTQLEIAMDELHKITATFKNEASR